jgi:hypothetical protein
MQQTTCKFKMAKCNWNVIKSDNSHNVWGEKGQKNFLCVHGTRIIVTHVIFLCFSI